MDSMSLPPAPSPAIQLSSRRARLQQRRRLAKQDRREPHSPVSFSMGSVGSPNPDRLAAVRIPDGLLHFKKNQAPNFPAINQRQVCTAFIVKNLHAITMNVVPNATRTARLERKPPQLVYYRDSYLTPNTFRAMKLDTH